MEIRPAVEAVARRVGNIQRRPVFEGNIEKSVVRLCSTKPIARRDFCVVEHKTAAVLSHNRELLHIKCAVFENRIASIVHESNFINVEGCVFGVKRGVFPYGNSTAVNGVFATEGNRVIFVNHQILTRRNRNTPINIDIYNRMRRFCRLRIFPYLHPRVRNVGANYFAVGKIIQPESGS